MHTSELVKLERERNGEEKELVCNRNEKGDCEVVIV